MKVVGKIYEWLDEFAESDFYQIDKYEVEIHFHKFYVRLSLGCDSNVRDSWFNKRNKKV